MLICDSDEAFEANNGGVPVARVARCVGHLLDCGRHRTSARHEVGQVACGDGLNYHGAQRRPFGWPGDHPALASVGRKLAEQGILAAATHPSWVIWSVPMSGGSSRRQIAQTRCSVVSGNSTTFRKPRASPSVAGDSYSTKRENSGAEA